MDTITISRPSARLCLQPLKQVVEKAVDHIRMQSPDSTNVNIEVSDQGAENVYGWIDSDLFEKALTILLKDLSHCPRSNSNIIVSLKKKETNICQILITRDSTLSHPCGSPVSVTDCFWHNENWDDAQNIIEMHGGYLEVWNKSPSSECFFEIRLLYIGSEKK